MGLKAVKPVVLTTFNKKVKEEIVEELKELLGRAERGEFESFAWAAGLKNGASHTGYTRSVDFHTLLSGVVTLQYRMIAAREISDEVKDDA